MRAFSTPSVSHGKHRCFTEANGAFQAGQTGKRRAHYIAKVNRENFACLGKPFPKHLDTGNVIRIWHLCTRFFRATKDVID
jgi:hypothetical protein